MHRYEELEKLYYKKKYLKIFNYIVITGVIIGIGGIIYYKKDSFLKTTPAAVVVEKKPQIKKVKQEKNTTKIVQSKKTEKPKKEEIKKLSLYPIFPDVSKIKDNTDNKKQVEKKQSIKKTPPKQEKTDVTPKPKKVEKIKIVVTQQKETIKNLIKLYKVEPTYDKAMKIANLYFDKKDYVNTITWSKKANKINPEKDDSWYLFAKSLLQLGNKKQAKKVLVVYLNTYTNSDKIEKLLRSIK